jgi:hypothetical protein
MIAGFVPIRCLRGALLCSLLGAGGPLTAAESASNWTRPYNIVWDKPGSRGFDSMPIGGGNIALNVWTENDGLLCYIGSPDSWNDGPDLVKIGRLRVTLTPSPFGRDFRQELDVASNSVRVSGRCEDGNQVSLRVWVDAFHPVVHVEGSATAPVTATVALESWRDEKSRHVGNAIEWQHRNGPANDVRAKLIEQQSIQTITELVSDPLKDLTFGGRVSAAGMVADGSGTGTQEGVPFRSLRLKTSAPAQRLDIRVAVRIAKDATLEKWQQEVATLETTTRDTAAADDAATRAWWAKFWDRSRIVINPDNKDPNNKPWQVGRNYQLFRAMLGSNSSGRFPTLFNGGAFMCDADPDGRNWGRTYFMSQNQRLVYWPLIKSGDDDLLRVALDFYAGHAKLQTARAKLQWGIDGAIFPELMNLFGLDNTPDKDGHSSQWHLKHHYTTAIEFAFMMLEYCRYSGADVRPYLPVAEGIIHWYDQYYRAENRKRGGSELDPAGRLVLEPSSALEQFPDARNNTDAIAGLMALTDSLLALPGGVLPPASTAFYQKFRSTLPPIPSRTMRGQLCLAPVEQAQAIANDDEFPAMYAVFPFGIYGMAKPDLELARNTWWHGYLKTRQKRNFCWYQSSIFTARLGLTGEAADFAVGKFLGLDTNNPQAPKRTRYPAFWDNTGYDQTPDMDHGGAAMIGLQEMLLQANGRQILLFPAWPADWDVDLKLHAPYQTTVEASLRKGKITKLVVTPASRAADVVDLSGNTPPPKPPRARQAEDSLTFGRPTTAASVADPKHGPGNAVDGDRESFWLAQPGASDDWLQVDLGGEKEVGSVMIQVAWRPVQIHEFAVEYQTGGMWKEATRGANIDTEIVLDFPPVRAKDWRLRILKSDGAPSIREFHLFPPR